MSPEDLFAAAAERRLATRAPLAARLRPRTLDEMVGQQHLVGPGAPLRVLVERDQLRSAILWGPPGTGKTTLARLLADTGSKAWVPLSAMASGVREVREELEAARRRLGEHGRGTTLFVDEVHRFNKAQQDVLLPAVEDGLVVLVGATTENPYFEVNAPLLSRSTLWRLHPLGDEDLAEMVRRGLAAEGADLDGGLGITEDAMDAVVLGAAGDARAALTTLEVAAALARARAEHGEPAAGAASRRAAGSATGQVTATFADVAEARDGRVRHQGPDEHYDQISAFIKSVRGSDPDAGLYWLSRMLDAGEDARFLARRLVILASEDIGMADPLALVVATSAAHAVELVGLPEAALNLAQATVHLALAPKSNRVTVALGRAREDVEHGGRGDVPTHLRDSHYRGAAAIGHGEGYRYPHDDPSGWVDQQYRPVPLAGHVYYEPTERGAEAGAGARLHRPGGAPGSRRRGGSTRAPRPDGER